MKRIITLMLSFLLLFASLIILQNVSGASQEQNVKIVFDNKNATLSISVNNSQYFHLKFSRILISTTPYFSPHMMNFEKIENMNIERTNSHNSVMGNYTKVTMWKDFQIQDKMHHGKNEKNIHVRLTLNFYIAEKTYKKKNVNITKNMIRYDMIITTDTKNTYIFLEEHMNYGEREEKISRVFECSNRSGNHWKMMNPTNSVEKHHFGSNHLGMVGFGRNNVTFKYIWEYQDNINTLYSYDGSNFVLYFIFKDQNGSVIQDPYITLPTPISGNVSAVVSGIEHTVSYIMDHAISLGVGLLLAVMIIFSAPLIKRRRL